MRKPEVEMISGFFGLKSSLLESIHVVDITMSIAEKAGQFK